MFLTLILACYTQAAFEQDFIAGICDYREACTDIDDSREDCESLWEGTLSGYGECAHFDEEVARACIEAIEKMDSCAETDCSGAPDDPNCAYEFNCGGQWCAE